MSTRIDYQQRYYPLSQTRRFLTTNIFRSGMHVAPFQTGIIAPNMIMDRNAKRSMSRMDNNEEEEHKGSTSQDGLGQTRIAIVDDAVTFEGKRVPLGKSSGLSVRRILPYYQQRSVGPFVFLDHFRPEKTEGKDRSISTPAAMDVGPHPHIGLATLSYLYQGSILHRDSTGAERLIVPKEVNFMISGKGVVHSERGAARDIKAYIDKQQRGGTPVDVTSSIFDKQHGLQFWMALSKGGEDVPPSFHHGEAIPITVGPSSSTASGMLVVGTINGISQESIPIDPQLHRVFCADIKLSKIDDAFDVIESSLNTFYPSNMLELGLYLVSGSLEFEANSECTGQVGNGRSTRTTTKDCDQDVNRKTALRIPGTMSVYKMTMPKTDGSKILLGKIKALAPDTRVAVFGGSPLQEKRFLKWNFVSTNVDKIEQASRAWSKLDRTKFPPVVNEDNLDSIPMPRTRSNPKI